MSVLDKIQIRVAPLSNRVILARFGKDPHVALETRNAMPDFLKALVDYAYDGKMPAPGGKAELKFGGGDEQFTLMIRRER